MTEEETKQKIATLKTQLTGNLFEDSEIQQEIYELKLQLNPQIALHPELDEEECLSCGS